MELLYKSSVPLGRVHCVAWSRSNLLALTVSVRNEGFLAKSFQAAITEKLVVVSPDRPWEFHCVASDYKSVVVGLSWSGDGSRLLALSADNTVRVWRAKTHSLNNWVCANKVDGATLGEVLHVDWLDQRPMATLHHSKTEWTEAIEVQPFSPHLRMVLGSGFVSIATSGVCRVDSTSVSRVGESGELCASVQLPGSGVATIARTHVTQSGSLLCALGYESGQVKVFHVTLALCWGSEFRLTACLATELHQLSSERVGSMVMLPLSDGCEVHLSYTNGALYKWSVKDITRSGSFQSRREGSSSMQHPPDTLIGSALCLGSHDPSANENKMSDLLDFGDVDMMKDRGSWPLEVVGCGTREGVVTLFSRSSCKALASQQVEWVESDQPEQPAASKKRRLDDSEDTCLVALSPNACCLAVARGRDLLLYNTGSVVLGLNESSSPVVPRCSRLLSLSLVCGHSPWDVVVTISRLEHQQGGGLVRQVLEHFTEDYLSNSSSLKSQLLEQFHSTCALLHSAALDGLLPSLCFSQASHVHATASLLALSLPSDGQGCVEERLAQVCRENSSEASIETLAESLEHQSFVIATDSAQALQGHCHWLVETAIRVVSRISNSTEQSMVLPVATLGLVRQCLLLVYLWNKALAQPILPITDTALSLLFRALTLHLDSAPYSDELQAEISANIPSDLYANILSLSKASQLQGFINGLSATQLPESFIYDKPCRIRPAVQRKYSCLDPYSPLTLVVPQGLSPPWRDCFLEGVRDVIHGGGITTAVTQSSRLKQCSRCRNWTVSADGPDQGLAPPAQQWRSGWSHSCLCGGSWLLHHNSRA